MPQSVPTQRTGEARLQGMGCKRKRVEDIRFIQGKGNYVDDFMLPGTLFGDFSAQPLRTCADHRKSIVQGHSPARR